MSKKTRRNTIPKYILVQDKQRKNQSKYHTDDEEYELLLREAYPRTLQILFEERMIGRDVTKRLETIRKLQRKAGIPDEKFYTPAKRRELGLPPLRGRYVRRFEIAS